MRFCNNVLYLQCFEPWFVMYMNRYDHHTEESYIEECWNHLKRRRVLEEPLRVDACIQSSKRYRTMAETLASKDADNSD